MFWDKKKTEKASTQLQKFEIFSCFGACDGNASVTISGGSGAYSIIWDSNPFQTNAFANSLCNGAYNVTVTDGNGCSESETVMITQPQQISLAGSSTSSTCGLANGSACVNVIGG